MLEIRWDCLGTQVFVDAQLVSGFLFEVECAFSGDCKQMFI